MVSPVNMNLAPMIITVAPNGARRTQADHPAVPVTAAEIAATARLCMEAGASMLHLHVRDKTEGHILDAEAYVDATAAVRKAVGDGLIVQITTEAVGRYSPAEQMAVVRAVRPEAVSIAVRELVPDAAHEDAAAAFFSELAGDGVLVQHILYSLEDVRRLLALREKGILAPGPVCPLFVLGRYAKDMISQPVDLLPFVEAWAGVADPWMVCAFGPREAACCAMAAALGGHARVGFENNLWLPNGLAAPHNAALVQMAAQAGSIVGRAAADVAEARSALSARVSAT